VLLHAVGYSGTAAHRLRTGEQGSSRPAGEEACNSAGTEAAAHAQHRRHKGGTMPNLASQQRQRVAANGLHLLWFGRLPVLPYKDSRRHASRCADTAQAPAMQCWTGAETRTC
jgi:hypothetical protein